MTHIELAPEVGEDFERILEHLMQHDVTDAPQRIGAIIEAIDVLRRNPLIGRPARGELRELVIGTRSRGYIALYLHVAEIDTAFVLAVRSQREAGFVR